jgi:putative ATP-dependent endonuclease of OLD family
LELLEALVEGGLNFGGFVDNEGLHPSRWNEVGKKMKNLLYQWPKGCLEENIIPELDPSRLEEFIRDPEGEETGERLRTLADRLHIQEKDFANIRMRAGDRMIQLIVEAALGKIPDDKRDADEPTKKALKKHKERWFKSRKGGRELAHKVMSFGVWPKLQPQILPFLNAVRHALGLPEISSLQP